MIRNAQAEAIPSNITLVDFGRAMSRLDLAGVPPHKRASAIIDHLGRIMSETATNPSDRTDLLCARLLRAKGRRF